MERTVTIIPATKHIFTSAPTGTAAKRRVAAYARVSTDNDEQFTSYEAQIDYYTKYIQQRDDWEFVKVYTDEGISGTNTKRREGFNTMIADALDGKIDLIVTKSVSRFARNTVDSLSNVRKLKEAGVEVFFEKENIYTFDGKGELLITIMSSLAQEESRSISENVTWGQRKRFQDGKVSMPYGAFLGYDRGPDGKPVINEEQAKVVRRIYYLFLQGMTPNTIAETLTSEHIPTPGGKTKWRDSTVRSILQNEKYKGDALLQKKFTIDFLSHRQKKNTGEVPQVYVRSSHPAIITPEEFDLVQDEFVRRQMLGQGYSGRSLCASKLVCGDCGGYYGRKTWHSNTTHRKAVWFCNNKYKGEEKCLTPTVTEEYIKQLFVEAYNQLMGDRAAVLAACEQMRQVVADCEAQDETIAAMNAELATVGELAEKCINDSAAGRLSAGEFDKRYNKLQNRYDTATKKKKVCEEEKASKIRREREIRVFMKELEKRPLIIDEWDSELWHCLLDKATIYRDHHITFRFRDGTEITLSTMNGEPAYGRKR